MVQEVIAASVDGATLRAQISAKYTAVAETPEAGFHFHNGRPLAGMLGYAAADVDWLPAPTVESFAGTGNPLALGALPSGATVVDVGCGAGFDSLQAARQVGPSGRVIGVDMTPAMPPTAADGAAALGLAHPEFCEGVAEALPVESGAADVVISNGVINLCPDKMAVLREVARVLKPGGRVQIADIVVHQPVPQEAKDDIELWSG